jgi:hypothetical protein
MLCRSALDGPSCSGTRPAALPSPFAPPVMATPPAAFDNVALVAKELVEGRYATPACLLMGAVADGQIRRRRIALPLAASRVPLPPRRARPRSPQ